MYKYRTCTCNRLRAKNPIQAINSQNTVGLSDPIAASGRVQNSVCSWKIQTERLNLSGNTTLGPKYGPFCHQFEDVPHPG